MHRQSQSKLKSRQEKSHEISVALRRNHIFLWFAAICIAIVIRHHQALHWFAVVCMLAIVTWVLIDLFGPVLQYRLVSPLQGALDSPEFVRELEALVSSRAAPNTLIEPLPNGVNFYEAEIQAIAQAQKSINWVAYIFARGEIARRMTDALAERARAGVEVNLVIDALGSFSMPKRFFAELTNAGGHVRWFHPMRWYNWPRANNRTHRELIVIDGRISFIGGAGVADHWWHGVKKEPAWRDNMFRVTGDAVRFLQSSFLENWLESSGQILAGINILLRRRIPMALFRWLWIAARHRAVPRVRAFYFRL
ncbi:MAG TPA: phospholipase D-like domain-containing protein [Candidatus Angelobacter sp.]|jgi:cardiolipin synthase